MLLQMRQACFARAIDAEQPLAASSAQEGSPDSSGFSTRHPWPGQGLHLLPLEYHGNNSGTLEMAWLCVEML